MKRKAQKQRTKKRKLGVVSRTAITTSNNNNKKIHRRKGKKLKVIRPKVGGRRRKSRYSLAVKEETIKRFREFYADNDFQTHDTFPNSKLPLPGMYMYLTLRGSFVESKIKTKHTASKFSDVYWFFHNKKTGMTTRCRSTVEVKKYFASKHRDLLKDDAGIKTMFNAVACMKLKCCLVHVNGSPRPPHPYDVNYEIELEKYKKLHSERLKKEENII